MAVTAKEIAKIIGISPAAVSMALNNKPGVSEATRELVFNIAQKYGYKLPHNELREIDNIHRNGSICFVIYKKSGAVVADTPFFAYLSEGISQGCVAKN